VQRLLKAIDSVVIGFVSWMLMRFFDRQQINFAWTSSGHHGAKPSVIVSKSRAKTPPLANGATPASSSSHWRHLRCRRSRSRSASPAS